MNRKRVGKRLRILRGKRTAVEVAIACGVTKQAICNYEAGRRMPSDDIKKKLAHYFGMSVQAIFFDD